MKTPYIHSYSKYDNISGGGSGGTNKFTANIPLHESGDGLLLYIFGGSRSHSIPVGWKALTPSNDPSNNRFHYKVGNGIEQTVDIFFKDTYFSGACICFVIKDATNNPNLISHKFFPEAGYLPTGSNIVYCPVVDVIEDSSLCLGIFHNGRSSKVLSVTGAFNLERIYGSTGEAQFAIASPVNKGKSPLISFSGFPNWHDWIRSSTLIIPPQTTNKSVIIQQILGA